MRSNILFFLPSPLLLIIALLIFPSNKATADGTIQYCLSCHANANLSLTLSNKENLSLYLSPSMVESSVHFKQGIECIACHTDISSYPHPKLSISSKRELSRSYYLSCKKCHSINYEKTKDSIHEQIAEQGNPMAPICTDCHGAHDTKPVEAPKTTISFTCKQCHGDIYNEYKDSIHGYALIKTDNQDVPVCTDCHGVHNIDDPRTVKFHNETPELCAGCHAQKELMSKYGLSSNVYDLYKASWHGVEISVYKSQWPTIWHSSAICTDCHGVHNIRSAKDPKSSVNPKNLLTTCQKCHPGTNQNFVQVWTGHNPITLAKTPFLYYTNEFYNTFIPLLFWLMIIYIMLQIIHQFINRARSMKQ